MSPKFEKSYYFIAQKNYFILNQNGPLWASTDDKKKCRLIFPKKWGEMEM